jgi:hypothetical protein
MNEIEFREDDERYIRQRAAALEQLDRRILPFGSMLERRRASQWITRVRGDQNTTRDTLFGDIWRSGEVAVMFGDKGVGKSIFAVQLAERLASGLGPAERSDGVRRRLKVLYFDLQSSTRRFAERYSAPSPMRGKPRVRCRFHFTRVQLNWDFQIPEVFGRDVDSFLRHSIVTEIEETSPDVVIFDDLSYLGSSTTGGPGCLRAMKSLKLYAVNFGISILLLAQRREGVAERGAAGHAARFGLRKGKSGVRFAAKPLLLEDLTSAYIAQQADTVFALGRSTASGDVRYLKHLASPRKLTYDGSNVLTYNLERFGSPPHLLDEPKADRRSTLRLGDAEPPQPECFLGFRHLGPSAEPDHLRDYEAEAGLAELQRRDEQKRLARRSSKQALAEAVANGEYQKYLEGR